MGWWRRLVLLGAVMDASVAVAQTAAPTPAPPVETPAVFVSVLQERDGSLYARLKLVPLAKIPFTTQVFRVRDRALLAGIPEGAWVRFTARTQEGENTLTSIRVGEACRRFQPCK